MLLSNVTAPGVDCSALPFSTAPVASVIAPVFERMVPLKIEVVPRVAPLPTVQKTL